MCGDRGANLFIESAEFPVAGTQREISIGELAVLIRVEADALADHAIGTFRKAAGETTLFNIQPILDANTYGGVRPNVATEVGTDVILSQKIGVALEILGVAIAQRKLCFF